MNARVSALANCFDVMFDCIPTTAQAAFPFVALGHDVHTQVCVVVCLGVGSKPTGFAERCTCSWCLGCLLGVGPDRTAVLSVGSTSILTPGFGCAVFADYCYLCSSHPENATTYGSSLQPFQQRVHQSIAGARNCGLHTGFRRNLFRTWASR